METLSLLLCGVLLLLGTLFLYSRNSKRAQFIRMMEQIPGPRAYPIIGTVLPFLLKKRSDFFEEEQKIITKHGPLFRSWVGPVADVSLTRPEHVEVVLSSSKHLDKAFAYNFLHSWLGTGLLTATGQKWHTHRKMITPTFHFKILDNFVEVFSENSEILVSKLQKEVGSQGFDICPYITKCTLDIIFHFKILENFVEVFWEKSQILLSKLKEEVGSQGFDVFPYITKCTLDIICETAMGTEVHAQDSTNSDYISAVYDMSELTTYRMIRPWLYLDWMFRLTAAGRRHDECLKVLHGFTNRVIQEHKELHAQTQSKSETSTAAEEDALGRKRRLAFLDLLLEASHDGVKMTDEELREEVDTFMFEGHDTTSAGISWAVYLLGLHTDIQNKVCEELDEIFQGSDRPATIKDLNEMKYLERVIKESLRLYPSVPFIAREITEDIQINKYTIPAGVTTTIHIYYLHRNPDQFPNPEKFDPDNFLPERVAKRHPYAYIPFSAGPRNCIGQKFALLEEKMVLSCILRHYKLCSLDKREDINLMAELILRPEKGLQVIITPRD